MNTLATVLKELRKQHNLSQKEIADIIKISQRAYCFYENGRREPDLDTLIKLADYYSVSLDILVGRYMVNK